MQLIPTTFKPQVANKKAGVQTDRPPQITPRALKQPPEAQPALSPPFSNTPSLKTNKLMHRWPTAILRSVTTTPHASAFHFLFLVSIKVNKELINPRPKLHRPSNTHTSLFVPCFDRFHILPHKIHSPRNLSKNKASTPR